jgi:hypothetical protein
MGEKIEVGDHIVEKIKKSRKEGGLIYMSAKCDKCGLTTTRSGSTEDIAFRRACERMLRYSCAELTESEVGP